MAKKEYKTNKKYKCPYCDKRLTRGDLINHINNKHETLIPQGYTATRVVYEIVNKKDHGTCMICKEPVYEWNEKVCRYNNLCNKKSCREQVRKIALERHIRVYNKPTLLGDPEHQEKMLARRKISKKYKFSDGGELTYTGTYEGKTLEFMDKVLNIPSSDIQSPGPIFEYEYKGERHFWITDIYYIPANLVIEVKDGGDNPNNRSMPDYRAKQVAKEQMITSMGTFHYLRLTNNNFEQLLDILADIKMAYVEQENPIKARIHVNEYMAMGGMNPVVGMKPSMIIAPYAVYGKDDIDGIAYFKDDDDEIVVCDESGIYIKSREFLSNKNIRLFRLESTKERIDDFMTSIKNTHVMNVCENVTESNKNGISYSFKCLSEMMRKPMNITNLILDENISVLPNNTEYFNSISKDVYESITKTIPDILRRIYDGTFVS